MHDFNPLGNFKIIFGFLALIHISECRTMSKKKSPLEEVEGDPSNVKCKVRRLCPGENDKDDTIRKILISLLTMYG